MNNRARSGVFFLLTAALTVVSAVPFNAAAKEYTVGEVQSLIDGIVDYKLGQAGAGSVQDWINGDITANAGTKSEWYVISLSQDGWNDFSAYSSALESFLANNDESSAAGRQKYALALLASGSTNPYISDILDDSIGAQGIMSFIYGLHVLNNGAVSTRFTAEGVAEKLVSKQFGDGGWALFGEYGDIDVTAMTMTALSPFYGNNPAVHEAVDRGIDFLSQRQEDNGGYQSFGTANPESAAQVLTALSALGIDGVHDERFIKNGNCLIDGIAEYRLSDGSFSHTKDGAPNETATVQALYSFIAYKRMTEGRTPLFIFDNRKPAETPAAPIEAAAQSGGEVHTQPSHEVTENAVTSGKISTTTTASNLSSTATAAAKITTSAKTTTLKVTSLTEKSSFSSAINEQISTAAMTRISGELKEDKPTKSNNKLKIIIIICGSAVVLCLLLLIIGKRNLKNFLFIFIITGGAIAFVMFNDIQSADEYYNGKSANKDNVTGTVTLEIRCDTIVGKSESEHIPDDGTILEVTDFEIEQGETVFDLLTEAAQTYGIHVENKGSAGSAHGMAYIAGINYIYEYDFGDLSGWVYHVNGITPSRSCGEYVLSDGDEVQWLYTCELGHDLNEVYEE